MRGRRELVDDKGGRSGVEQQRSVQTRAGSWGMRQCERAVVVDRYASYPSMVCLQWYFGLQKKRAMTRRPK